MRYIHTIIILLFGALCSGQVVNVPTLPEVNRKLDSLATVLRSEMGSVTPVDPVTPTPDPEPGLPDCPKPVSLVEVYDVSGSGLEYNFYSEGVARMTERIYNAAGQEVFRHTTDPVTRDRVGISYDLPAGEYSITVENADCKAVSNRVYFTVSGTDPPVPDPNPDKETPIEPQPTGFDNPGVYRLESNGKLYEWIPSENVDIQVVDGRVRIIAPETKQSREGGNTCKRYLLSDLFDNRLPEAEERALFGEGLTLPNGNYEFKILYLNAPNWNAAVSNMWEMVGYSDTHRGGYRNSAGVETLKLSITDGTPIHGFSADQWRTSWVPQYQLLPGTLSLPEGKAFGVTRYIASVPKDRLLDKITHIQYTYSWVDGISKSRAWRNMQALTHEGIQEPQWHIDRAILEPGYILMSEYAENYGNHFGCPPCYEKAEQVYQGIYNRFVNERGVTSPNQTGLGSDYFSPLYGGSVAMDFDVRSSYLTDGLSNLTRARSALRNNVWSLSAYFSNGWHDYRNYFSQGYIGNLLAQAGKPGLVSRIYNHEKVGLAIPDRRKITYATNAQEGLHMDIATISGTWYKTKFPEGELLRADGITNSFQTMLSDAFFALLLGDIYLIWESNLEMSTDLYTFDRSWFGGKDDWKTRWKPSGGTAAIYIPRANGPERRPGKGQFPEKPLTGDQGSWIGAKMYEQFGAVNSVTWADYERDGTRIVAKRGANGTAKANVNGVQNFGQDNSVLVYEKKLPVCLIVESEKGRFVVFQDEYAGLTGKQLITVEGRGFLITGNRLNVYKL